MKRGTIDHPKMKRLTRALGCEDLMAVGIMESLWHFASRYAPRGDIGRFTDDEIADAIKYRGDGTRLTAALTESGWVDVCATHRLVLHDWFEHADDAVHMTLARAVEKFASGKIPRLTRLSKQERERIEPLFRAHGKRTASARNTHAVRTANAQPSHPPPSPAKPSSTGEDQIAPAPVLTDSPQDHPPARLLLVAGKPDDGAWADEPAAIWREAYGGEVDRRDLIEALAGPREKLGHLELMQRWRNYVAMTPALYQPSPRKFASAPDGYTDENRKKHDERSNRDGRGPSPRGPGGGKRPATGQADRYAAAKVEAERRTAAAGIATGSEPGTRKPTALSATG